jgi:4-amino-4-deoxy-L-arabinose transferase-like glycosyltransferase
MRSFRLVTLAVFAAATVPRLAQRGMFVDGVTYASIARNLAEGRGSFWTPFYTETLYPQFHQHPPLGLWLQSLWFRALGDHLFVERAYALAAATVTAVLMALIWRAVTVESTAKNYEWLPILFWILVPVVSWSVVGNMLETTVSVFTTAAVAAAVVSASAASTPPAVAWGVASGLCVAAAAATKGPVGLFPLAAPLLSFVARKRGRVWSVLVPQWTTTILVVLLVLSVEVSRHSLYDYLNQQLLPAVGRGRQLTPDSFFIVKMLLQGVWLPMLILGAIWVAAARGFAPISAAARSQSGSLLTLGLAGTLPILVSSKQMGHYLVPAVPFFALAAASLIYPTVARLVERIGASRVHLVTAGAAAIIAGTVGAVFVPALERDRERISNLDALSDVMPQSATVGICAKASDDWGLHAWFARRFRVSLDPVDGARREWFLKTGPFERDCPPSQCAPMTDAAKTLVLLTCRKN